jgi:hypothetical protein
MTPQEAISKIDAYLKSCEDCGWEDIGDPEPVMRACREALCELLWVPIDQDTPDHRDEVLGWQTWRPDAYWCEGAFLCSRVDKDSEYSKAGQWFTQEGDKLPNVTHWMPVPRGPEATQ